MYISKKSNRASSFYYKIMMLGFGLAGVFLFSAFYYFPFKEDAKCVDLRVLEIEEPDWNATLESTEVKVTFQNRGKGISRPVKALLKDFDPTEKELRKLPLQRNFKNLLISKNDLIVNDLYVDDTLIVPSLGSKEKITMTFTLKDHWVYDPYCELEVTVNFDHAEMECRFNNNSHQFLSSN